MPPLDGNPTDYAPAVAPVVPGTDAEIWSLPRFVAWLEKQPAEREYDYDDCEGACLIGQYLAHRGHPWEGDGARLYVRAPRRFDLGIACQYPHTFGAALARARSACGLSQPKGGGL